MGPQHEDVALGRQKKVTFQDYIEVVSGLCEALQQEQQNQLRALSNIIVDSVQELAPGLGMMKGLVTLLNTPQKYHDESATS